MEWGHSEKSNKHMIRRASGALPVEKTNEEQQLGKQSAPIANPFRIEYVCPSATCSLQTGRYEAAKGRDKWWCVKNKTRGGEIAKEDSCSHGAPREQVQSRIFYTTNYFHKQERQPPAGKAPLNKAKSKNKSLRG